MKQAIIDFKTFYTFFRSQGNNPLAAALYALSVTWDNFKSSF